MMGAALPTQDQVASATALLAALADPKGTQDRLNALSEAVAKHAQAATDAAQKITAAINAQRDLDARKAALDEREAAVAQKETLIRQQSDDLAAQSKSLVESIN